jgi:hypothetical protein
MGVTDSLALARLILCTRSRPVTHFNCCHLAFWHADLELA